MQRALENALADPQGRWILGAHRDAACELELSALIDNSVVRVKLDRTFIDEQGTRWIVDYKTSEIGSGNTRLSSMHRSKSFVPTCTGTGPSWLASSRIRSGWHFTFPCSVNGAKFLDRPTQES